MSAREQRRLTAIVAADGVGYMRLMGRDERGTVTRLRRIRIERLEPVPARRGGRVVKRTGDGALIEFASAVEGLLVRSSSGSCAHLGATLVTDANHGEKNGTAEL